MANPNRQFYVPTRYHHFPAMCNPNVFSHVRVNGTAQGISAGKVDITWATGDSGWHSLSRISYLPADISATAVTFAKSMSSRPSWMWHKPTDPLSQWTVSMRMM